MDLIKELGLEKCKAIVDGAPYWAHGFCFDLNVYTASNIGDKVNITCLSIIRNAIADHEKCQHDWNETTSNGDAYRFFVCKHCDSTQNYVPFKDDNPSHFDHCSDIGYHISPLTRVIEK